MPSWWNNLRSTIASYYREYEYVTAIYVLEPWERRWANGTEQYLVLKVKGKALLTIFVSYHD